MEPSSTAGAGAGPGLQLGALSGSGSRRSMGSWGSRRSGSISHSFRQPDDPFGRAASQQGHDDDEENLRWAALEKLPTYDRMRRAVILSHHGVDVDVLEGLVDIDHLASGEAGRALLERVFQDDSERFLRRLRGRVDRVGIDLPAIEIRYQGLSVEVDAFVGSRALPTLFNATTNFLQGVSQVSLSNPMRTVKVLAVRPSGYQLQAVLNILRWFPCLEKLYVMFDINGKPNTKIEPQYDPLHPIECLQTALKKVVFKSFIRYKEQTDFARFFVLNAKAVNKFEIEVYCEYNSEWVAYQQKLLQVENRASQDSQFEYKSSHLHTEFYLDKHIHDLLVADPFK